jgi:hypothetical protein
MMRPGSRRGRRKLLVAIKYGLFSFVSKPTGAVFWWSEQRKWKLADEIEQEAAG